MDPRLPDSDAPMGTFRDTAPRSAAPNACCRSPVAGRWGSGGLRGGGSIFKQNPEDVNKVVLKP